MCVGLPEPEHVPLAHLIVKLTGLLAGPIAITVFGTMKAIKLDGICRGALLVASLISVTWTAQLLKTIMTSEDGCGSSVPTYFENHLLNIGLPLGIIIWIAITLVPKPNFSWHDRNIIIGFLISAITAVSLLITN